MRVSDLQSGPAGQYHQPLLYQTDESAENWPNHHPACHEDEEMSLQDEHVCSQQAVDMGAAASSKPVLAIAVGENEQLKLVISMLRSSL